MKKINKILFVSSLSLSLLSSCKQSMIEGGLNPLTLPDAGVLINNLLEFKNIVSDNSSVLLEKNTIGFKMENGSSNTVGALAVSNINASNIYSLNITDINLKGNISNFNSSSLNDLKESIEINYKLEFQNNLKILNNIISNLNLPSYSLDKDGYALNIFINDGYSYIDLTSSKKVIDLYADISNSIFEEKLNPSEYYKIKISLDELNKEGSQNNIQAIIDNFFDENSKINKYINENYKVECRSHQNDAYSVTLNEPTTTYLNNINKILNKSQYNEYIKNFKMKDEKQMETKKVVYIADKDGPKTLGVTSYADASFDLVTPNEKGSAPTSTIEYVSKGYGVINKDDEITLKEFNVDIKSYKEVSLDDKIFSLFKL